ncbi:MAG: ATP-grasp domain-containing protein [Aerococcaceae bacterium]|nr:ATP-grasp domain-containing protein [Aerococcaceae bacterium]
MLHRHYPGETLGVIGDSIAMALVAQAAGKLGYRVASLVKQQINPVRQFASWQTVTEAYDESALRYFAGRVDFVVADTHLLTNRDYQLLSQLTEVTLSEDLQAISTDRLIEKAYLDEQRCLVAPFSMVTSLEDVKEAVEYIGFPCFLKTTQRHLPGSKDHLLMYSEEDYAAAQEKLALSTCVLEAWIPAEKEVSITVVRNERGELLIYPIFEVVFHSERGGKQVRYPANVGLEVEREVKRVGQFLAEQLDLIGALTVECFVTSAGVVYINEARVGLDDEAVFSLGSMSLSHFEALVRAVAGLALPELLPLSAAAIALPVEALNKEHVLTQFMLRTDWGFALFNPVGNDADYLTGQVIVTGDTLKNCQRQIEITELVDGI